jgi:hypothetical protein
MHIALLTAAGVAALAAVGAVIVFTRRSRRAHPRGLAAEAA